MGKGENSIFNIYRELEELSSGIIIEKTIGDIFDFNTVDFIFRNLKPEVVFHAAAHKHVHLMEINPREAFKNNVLGSYNVMKCAKESGVKHFVHVSTDKAVNPENVMGATKRVTELIMRTFSATKNSIFTAVRFGNVLGSRGSVIPIFKSQIEKGGPVTVTHKDVIRYFMTITEASKLVIQAGGLAKGGEIFVLDMGKPVKIIDMAKELIRLSGFEPDKDIEIVFTGLKPGEKLIEELLTADEGTYATKHEKIFIAPQKMADAPSLLADIDELYKKMYNLSDEKVKELIFDIVKKYS
jgi:FlaA1/EpsC-like NDP-sugar epimerase